MSWSLVNEQLVFANQRLIGRVTTLHIQTILGQWVSDKNGGFITIPTPELSKNAQCLNCK